MSITNLYPFVPNGQAAAGTPAGGESAAASCAPVCLADLVPLFGSEVADPRLAGVTFPVRRVRAGDFLVRAGDRFDAVYFVRCGFFKSVRIDEAGNEVVLGLPMTGEAIGLDGLDPGHYTADVIALDTSFVAVIPFAQLAQLGREHAPLERAVYRVFSRELGREHNMVWLLGTLTAEARVANFLLDLSERFGRLGYSRTAFELRMTRQEIGSYLGIKLETVSRTLSALAAARVIAVDRRTVILQDIPALQGLARPKSDEPDARTTSCTRRAAREKRPAERPARPAVARGAALAFA